MMDGRVDQDVNAMIMIIIVVYCREGTPFLAVVLEP